MVSVEVHKKLQVAVHHLWGPQFLNNVGSELVYTSHMYT